MNSNSSLNGKSNNKLSMFRNQIDEIDRGLMDILIRRVSLSKEIAAYKLENDLPIRDRDRELILIDDRTKKIDDPVVREALADVRSENDPLVGLNNIMADINSRQKAMEGQLRMLFAEDGEDKRFEAKQLVQKMQFLVRLQQEAEEMEEELVATL